MFEYTKFKTIIFMNAFKTSIGLWLTLITLFASPAFAQPVLGIAGWQETERAKEVMQDSAYVGNGKAYDNFFNNPLLLDGKALDYNTFSLQSKGVLTLIKGVTDSGKAVQIKFHVYLRRDGSIVKLPGDDGSKTQYWSIEISEILKSAKKGDLLIIEPANDEDGRATRVLKLLDDGC
jgi:hypothetical protein